MGQCNSPDQRKFAKACKFFKRGHCHLGADCSKRHDEPVAQDITNMDQANADAAECIACYEVIDIQQLVNDVAEDRGKKLNRTPWADMNDDSDEEIANVGQANSAAAGRITAAYEVIDI